MKKSSKGGKGSPKLEQAQVPEAVDDVKVKAVNEMMERIKHGVVLRPVKGQDTKRFGTKQPSQVTEEKQQESAMEELKGILDSVKKSPSRGFQEALPVKKDSELEVILRRRRRQACNPASADDMEGQISKVSSSDSLNGRHSSDSGKDTDRPGSSSLSGSDSSPRNSSDSGNEPNGAKPNTAVHISLTEKDSAVMITSDSCARERKHEGQESQQPSVLNYPGQSEEPQTTRSSSANDASANCSMDAEC